MHDWCIRGGCQQQLDLDVVVPTTHILKFSFKSCNLHKKYKFMYSCFIIEYICHEQVYNGLTYFENRKNIITAYAKVFWSLKHFLLFQKVNINYSNSSASWSVLYILPSQQGDYVINLKFISIIEVCHIYSESIFNL